MLAVLLTLLPAVARPAHAASAGISYSFWSVTGDSVMLRYTLPRREARRLVPPGWPDADTTTIEHYLLGHVAVRSAQGACPAYDQGYDIGKIDPLSVSHGLFAFEIMFRCKAPADMVLRNTAMYDRDPRHMDFARVQVDGKRAVPVLFTARHPEVRLAALGSARPSDFGRYLRHGFGRILHSLDRICFIIALLLLMRRRLEPVYVLAGLSLGYAAAVAFAAHGLLAVHRGAAGAWIGFMVALAAALLVVREMRRPRIGAAVVSGVLLLLAAAVLAYSPRDALMLAGAGVFAGALLCMAPEVHTLPLLWLIPAAVFGFVDGFALPSDLAELKLSALMPASGVLAFNLGAVLADAAIMAALLVVARLLRWQRRTVAAPLATDLAAAALAGLGAFWLLSRLMGH